MKQLKQLSPLMKQLKQLEASRPFSAGGRDNARILGRGTSEREPPSNIIADFVIAATLASDPVNVNLMILLQLLQVMRLMLI